ncbi:MAG: hypothetical protein QG573_2756 [Acidobacteriota bacterium]|nr:hypothetical protein [Acidobacteriota bacterium]
MEQDIRACGRNRMRLSGELAARRGARMQQGEIFRLEMERALVSSRYHRAEMRLAPGPQRVAVVVLDEVSGVQSTTFVELEIAEAN